MVLPGRIERLVRIAEKPERKIVGLMSGTSMDGLDVVLCSIAGHGVDTRFTVLQKRTISYSTNERTRIAALVSQEVVVLHDLCVLNVWLAELHAAWIMACLEDWGVPPSEVDCLASHGQTVYHAPGSWNRDGQTRHATLQLGDGDHLAVRTGILTLSDFRQKEVAGGGEGAPIAPYAESLILSGPTPRIMLNIGGIANFNWLPPKGASVLCVFGDTGPGNALIDRAVREFYPNIEEGFDVNGQLALKGTVNEKLLSWMKDDPYFDRRNPKSTGPETFGDAFLTESWERAQKLDMSPMDLIATFTRFTTETIADTLRNELPTLASTQLYGSGGGWRNSTLRSWLRESLPGLSFHEVEELGVSTDAKEGLLFAVLANEALAGNGFVPLLRGSEGRRYSFGKFSFPD
ncbi:MAG: anhydro-N-acetylmuramic acid kinase [Deltaproteobacteria bacterium]|nr:anhydro-N-acetylmuramic acid kinase [Deltaproteobacteria bacterium]